MSIKCPFCQSKAFISNRNTLCDTVADLYCQCKNTNCGAKFVYKLSFSHYIHEPIEMKEKAAKTALDVIKALSQEELAKLHIMKQVPLR